MSREFFTHPRGTAGVDSDDWVLVEKAPALEDEEYGPHRYTVEIAANDQDRQRGLMYRTKMAADAGMLFDFHSPQPTAFWMENTILPLDMLFVRADGTIANIRANAVPYSRESIPSAGPVLLVIELNAGQAAKWGIRAGDKVKAPELTRR